MCFLSFSGKNDAESSRDFIKKLFLNPKHAKFDQKSEFGHVRTCPGGPIWAPTRTGPCASLPAVAKQQKKHLSIRTFFLIGFLTGFPRWTGHTFRIPILHRIVGFCIEFSRHESQSIRFIRMSHELCISSQRSVQSGPPCSCSLFCVLLCFP